MNRHSLVSGLLIASCAFAATACGKKDSEKKAERSPNGAAEGGQAAPAPEAASPTVAVEVPPPPPELGMPYETFYGARLLQTCALKYHVADKTAERMAIEWTQGKKPELHLDAVFDLQNPKAKPAVEPKDDEAMALARDKWQAAVKLADAHTPTAAKLKEQTETCLYAPEIGLIEGKTIENYINVFVGVTCAQKQFTGADGKVDDVAHAQAAAKVFTDNAMTAGEFSRYGLIFSRFPIVIQQAYAARAKKCPGATPAPTVAAPQQPSAVYNGSALGERIGSIRLEERDGKLTGAVQWQGVPQPAADGRPQPPAILPLNGSIKGKTFTLAGETQGESFKATGKTGDTTLSGTWSNQRPEGKSKGTFTLNQLLTAAPVAAPK